MTAPLPHHRTCGSASGGSVKSDEGWYPLRVESLLAPVDLMTVMALNVYLTPSVLLPRSICSLQMSATSPSPFAFLLNSLTVWPFAL